MKKYNDFTYFGQLNRNFTDFYSQYTSQWEYCENGKEPTWHIIVVLRVMGLEAHGWGNDAGVIGYSDLVKVYQVAL